MQIFCVNNFAKLFFGRSPASAASVDQREDFFHSDFSLRIAKTPQNTGFFRNCKAHRRTATSSYLPPRGRYRARERIQKKFPAMSENARWCAAQTQSAQTFWRRQAKKRRPHLPMRPHFLSMTWRSRRQKINPRWSLRRRQRKADRPTELRRSPAAQTSNRCRRHRH